MSEILTIEILREKFKEAQEKGEELIVIDDLNREQSVLYVGDIAVFVKYKDKSKDENSVTKPNFYNWKIKQPKDEYEVMFEHYRACDHSLCLKIMTHKNKYHQFTGRKLLRNKRTGEIVEYNDELLK